MICLVFPLLLPTPTIWFSLHHNRNVSDGVVSEIGTLFSLDHKFYACDYDSDSESVASENHEGKKSYTKICSDRLGIELGTPPSFSRCMSWSAGEIIRIQFERQHLTQDGFCWWWIISLLFFVRRERPKKTSFEIKFKRHRGNAWSPASVSKQHQLYFEVTHGIIKVGIPLVTIRFGFKRSVRSCAI